MYCADRQYLANPRKPLVRAVFWGSTSGHLLAFRLGFAAYSTACTQRNDSTTKSTKSPNVWLRLTESWPLTSWERYIPCCTILERYIWLDKNGCLLITPVSVQLVEHRLITPTSGSRFYPTKNEINTWCLIQDKRIDDQLYITYRVMSLMRAGVDPLTAETVHTYLTTSMYYIVTYVSFERKRNAHWKCIGNSPPFRYLSN